MKLKSSDLFFGSFIVLSFGVLGVPLAKMESWNFLVDSGLTLDTGQSLCYTPREIILFVSGGDFWNKIKREHRHFFCICINILACHLISILYECRRLIVRGGEGNLVFILIPRIALAL